MRRKKPSMTDEESDAEMFKRHPEMRNAMTLDQIVEQHLRAVAAMSSMDRAKYRQECRKATGRAPRPEPDAWIN
jgi:hypothetical protein